MRKREKKRKRESKSEEPDHFEDAEEAEDTDAGQILEPKAHERCYYVRKPQGEGGAVTGFRQQGRGGTRFARCDMIQDTKSLCFVYTELSNDSRIC